jgi:hypothetical protein
MAPLLANSLPRHRAIVALDIERSTSRTDPVKAELRNKIYELFDAALRSAGIHQRHRDRFIDRGDGVLALIHPVDQAPKVLLLNHAIPALNRLLTDYNASIPHVSRMQRQLRVRVVVHAGEVHYDTKWVLRRAGAACRSRNPGGLGIHQPHRPRHPGLR